MRLLKLGEIDIEEIRSKVILDEALSKVKPIVEDVRKKGKRLELCSCDE